MISSPALPRSEVTFALCVVFILLVPLAAAGLSLINTGLGRSRSAAHALLSSMCVIAVAALVYFVCGNSWAGFPGRPSHAYALGGKLWSWWGADPFFLRGLPLDGSPAALSAWLQMWTVGLAALIPLGAGADRWRLSAICASTALLAGFTYPLFSHWAWGGGWLAQLGANYGIGHGFVDAGGSSTIQALGGFTALAITWILGPRRGKYAANGMPSAIPGHNIVLVLFGCLLAWIGWLALNCAGAILFTGATAASVTLIAINTTSSAAASSLVGVVITRLRFGKPDASLTANAWVGGLAAGSASCAFIKPAEAMMVGMVAGALVTLSVEWLEFVLRIDDPGGAIAVHALGGVWGILAVGLFGRFPDQVSGQWLAQVAGIATLAGFILPLAYGLNWLLNRVVPQRVGIDGERQGMDLQELGADAYPEFVTHTEEYLPH